MSLAGTRVGFRHIANFSRDSSLNTPDAWGSPVEPEWEDHLQSVPCHAWVESGMEASTQDRTLVTEARKISIPLGLDVTEKDQVASVTRVNGDPFFEGPMGIDKVTIYEDHIECVLERIHG